MPQQTENIAAGNATDLDELDAADTPEEQQFADMHGESGASAPAQFVPDPGVAHATDLDESDEMDERGYAETPKIAAR